MKLLQLICWQWPQAKSSTILIVPWACLQTRSGSPYCVPSSICGGDSPWLAHGQRWKCANCISSLRDEETLHGPRPEEPESSAPVAQAHQSTFADFSLSLFQERHLSTFCYVNCSSFPVIPDLIGFTRARLFHACPITPKYLCYKLSLLSHHIFSPPLMKYNCSVVLARHLWILSALFISLNSNTVMIRSNFDDLWIPLS